MYYMNFVRERTRFAKLDIKVNLLVFRKKSVAKPIDKTLSFVW